ncbi:putative uncharacterized protein [Bacteroides sp. CAG:633]|uniref:hypothetical protein n=1 Tax=Bacteroides sp. CAG:633 TaxID=1262744 RepID=UPI00033E7583|nr:hypothetical protein [Bacteroides sp. CAG:633]CDB10062.1 putative uncharacterized protein [Bacteroides sp. CAG:633]
MKRTTYIIIGMLFAGAILVIGTLTSIFSTGITWEESFLDIKGERTSKQMPECRVVHLMSKVEAKDLEERYVSFDQTTLKIGPTDSLTGSLTYTSELNNYMEWKTAGDTLQIYFSFPTDKLAPQYQKMKWLRVRSEAIQMNIPQGVEEIISENYNMHTQFADLSRDSLAFKTQGTTIINDCQIKSLSAKAPTLHFQSGQVDSLYLNLDFITEWTVDSDSFHIDTEHLSGSYEPNCYLQKNECRQVLWTPLSGKAQLHIKLKEKARINVIE